MHGMSWLGVIKSHQRRRLAKTLDRQYKAHMTKKPASQQPHRPPTGGFKYQARQDPLQGHKVMRPLFRPLPPAIWYQTQPARCTQSSARLRNGKPKSPASPGPPPKPDRPLARSRAPGITPSSAAGHFSAPIWGQTAPPGGLGAGSAGKNRPLFSWTLG